MRQEDLILSIGIGLAILFGLFLLLRELICWYYKINERIRLHKETNALLKQLLYKDGDNSHLTPLQLLNFKRDKKEITQEEYLKMLKDIK